MISLLTSLAPAIVSIVMAIMEWIGVKRENRKKFLQNVLNHSNQKVSIKLREKYRELLASHDTAQDDDVF